MNRICFEIDTAGTPAPEINGTPGSNHESFRDTRGRFLAGNQFARRAESERSGTSSQAGQVRFRANGIHICANSNDNPCLFLCGCNQERNEAWTVNIGFYCEN